MSKKNNNHDEFDDIPHVRKEPRPDFSTPPPKKKLPKALQATLDNEEKLWEALYEGHARESTESNVRYAAYASRVRTILLSAHRYVAYTSDIGESFRPIAHPYLVRGAYAVSWLYLTGDVAHEGYKAWLRNQRVLHPERVDGAKDATGAGTAVMKLGPGVTQTSAGKAVTGKPPQQLDDVKPGKVPAIEDYRAVMVQRAVFQSIASMGLPAFTIHSIVRYSGRALKDAKNKNIRTWMPIGLGLAAVPFLPFVFDEPVERAVEWAFHKGFETFGGPGAVGHEPVTGKKELRQAESKEGAIRDKEL